MRDATNGTRDGCVCEKRIAPSVLDGYACGDPDCWRTGVVQAAFDEFVADLVARREQEAARDKP